MRSTPIERGWTRSSWRRSGRRSMPRLEEAAARVRAVKEEIFGSDLRHPHPVDPQVAQWSVGTPAHIEVADRIAAATITSLGESSVPQPEQPLIIATRMARRFGA